MPNVSSSLGTTGQQIPLVNSTQLGKAAGLAVHFPDMTALIDAIGTVEPNAGERGNITNSQAIWREGQPFTVATEPSGLHRIWTIGASAALSHAKTIVLPSGKSFVLAADANVVIATTGAPSGGSGAVGDMAVDFAAGLYYVKSGASTWGSAVQIAAGASVGLASSAFSTVIPLDGTKVMQPIMAAGALTFTLQAENLRTPGASCLIKIAANGVTMGGSAGGPTITGAYQLISSPGWDSTAGKVNNILVSWDGSEAYYNITQADSEPAQTTFSAASVVGSTITLTLGSGGVAAGTMPAASSFALSTLAGGTTPVSDSVTAVVRASATSIQLTKSRAVVGGDVTSLSYVPPATAPLLNAVSSKRAFGLPPAAVSGATAYALDEIGVAAGSGVAYSTRRLRAAYTGPAIRVRRTNSAGTPIGSDFDVPFVTGSQELDLSVNAALAAGGTGLTGGDLLWVMKLYNQMSSGSTFDMTPIFNLQTTNLEWDATLGRWVITNPTSANPTFKINPAGMAAQVLSTASAAPRSYTHSGSCKLTVNNANSVAYLTACAIDVDFAQTRLEISLSGADGSRIGTGASAIDNTQQSLTAASTLSASSNGPLHAVSICNGTSLSVKINSAAQGLDSTATTPAAAVLDGLAIGGHFISGGFQGAPGQYYEFMLLPFAITTTNRDLLIANRTAYWG